jgi:hypothetical protein
MVASQCPQVMVAAVATTSSKSVSFPLTVRGSMMMKPFDFYWCARPDLSFGLIL